MKPCNQTKDFSCTLFGETLPRYEFYGRVDGTTYRADYFTGRLLIHDAKRNTWKPSTLDKNARIYNVVKAYIVENGLLGDHVEICHHRQAEKKEAFYRTKTFERRKRVERDREIMESAPHMRKATISAFGAAAHDYDSSRRRVAVETDHVFELDGYRGISADERDRGYSQPFEMGQNTSGTAGKYTRSGFETRKDGLKVDQTKIRPDRMTRPDYMKVSGQPASVSMDKLAKKRHDKAVAHISAGVGNNHDFAEVQYYNDNYNNQPK